MPILRQITSVSHPLIKHFVKLRQNGRYRDEHRSVVVEGVKLVTEISREHQPKKILVTDMSLIQNEFKDAELIQVNEMVMRKASGMVEPEGLLAEIVMPEERSLDGHRLIVAFDSVSDPGNVGTLLRTALALGWEGAFFLGNHCDPYNEKAIRAARGACFHLPLRHGSWQDLEKLVHRNGLTPLVADITGCTAKQICPLKSAVLVLSNEAHGPSPQALALCRKITIPMSAAMESLNVAIAGGILMYLLHNP